MSNKYTIYISCLVMSNIYAYDLYVEIFKVEQLLEMLFFGRQINPCYMGGKASPE